MVRCQRRMRRIVGLTCQICLIFLSFIFPIPLLRTIPMVRNCIKVVQFFYKRAYGYAVHYSDTLTHHELLNANITINNTVICLFYLLFYFVLNRNKSWFTHPIFFRNIVYYTVNLFLDGNSYLKT